MPYRFSKKAEQDLISIYIDGAEQFGEAQAIAYHHDLEKVFDLLAENPAANRERDEFYPAVRVHPHKSHLVVYSGSLSEGIYIVRVLHKREDWRNMTFSQ